MLQQIEKLSLNPITPFSISLLYVIYSIRQNNKLRNVEPLKRKKLSLLTFMMVLHNLILCIFSLTVFIKTFPVIFQYITRYSLRDFINDPHRHMQDKLDFWIWIFYVSKIYEIFDSILLHVNQRPTSFLQMYHHAGAIICCWMLSVCDTHLPWIFVVLNSFIHTVMYFYYILTCVGIRPPFKRLITRMQIAQFVSGSATLIFHVIFYKRWGHDKLFKILTLVLNLVYVSGLFVLFKRFEKKTYTKKKVE
jgi:hypothetical protein